MDFRALIEHGVSILKQKSAKWPSTLERSFEVGDPRRDDELRVVEKNLGFQLAPSFVELFRAANGFRVQRGKTRAHVRPLRELFAVERERFFPPCGAERTKFLGGMQSATLFDRQRTIGGITDLDPEGREVVALYADAAHPDPIALLVTDYGADATNHRPVRARDLLWLLALSLDLKEVVLQSWFEALGFDGDHPIVEPGISE